MSQFMLNSLISVLILAFSTTAFAAALPDLKWAPLNESVPGIEFVKITGDFTILKIDAALAPLTLINASETKELRTLSATADKNQMVFATNAAMFRDDNSSSIGYMRNFEHVNQKKFRGNLKAILAWNPKKKNLPPVKIVIKEESNWEKKIGEYETVFESYRLIASDGKGGWTPTWKPGQTVAHHVGFAGIDGEGKLLIFFHVAGIDVYEFTNRIMALGLDVKKLMYLDGDFHGGIYYGPGSQIRSEGGGFLAVPNIFGVKFP